ncbi:uncharacterized protein DS421_12g354380 [Arachis hypogaea]|nr:uncharacterized protein DS421_12g354380 [Arachis hypogaea]
MLGSSSQGSGSSNRARSHDGSVKNAHFILFYKNDTFCIPNPNSITAVPSFSSSASTLLPSSLQQPRSITTIPSIPFDHHQLQHHHGSISFITPPTISSTAYSLSRSLFCLPRPRWVREKYSNPNPQTTSFLSQRRSPRVPHLPLTPKTAALLEFGFRQTRPGPNGLRAIEER